MSAITKRRPFARGKRGIVEVGMLDGNKVAIKRARPESRAVGRIAHEAAMLQRVNSLGIGPRFISYDGAELVMAFVEGTEIVPRLKSATPRKALGLLQDVFAQCYALDRAGLQKEEMHHPTRHVIVTPRGNAVLIDFERCALRLRAHNVTQFCQFVASGNLEAVWERMGRTVDARIVRSLARQYIGAPDDRSFGQVLGYLEMALLRPFHHAVAQRCFSVPEGKVTTYADIARSMGMSAYRAVGMAMKRNPCAPVVPCHRVVASDGSIGGWSGGGSKEAMLQKEGVLIRDGRVVDFERKRHAF